MNITAAVARTYVRAHYVAILVAAAVAIGGYALHEHDARIRSEVLWKGEKRAADSVLQVRYRELAGAKAKTDTASRRVEQLLAVARVDTQWVHDTLRIAGDTTLRVAVPLPTVIRQQETNAACDLLAVRCKAERVAAENRAAAAEHELQVVQSRPERSCAKWFWAGTAVGAAGDEAARGRFSLFSLHF